MTRETTLALAMLRKSPNYVEDAREGAPVGNSVVGSLMSLQYGIPRQYAEAGVAHALAILDQEKERPLSLELSRGEVEELIQGLSWSCDQGMELDEQRVHALRERLEALLKYRPFTPHKRFSMARYKMDDDTVVDTDKAVESWEEATDWNGNNHISRATGSQWHHQTLHLSQKGRYYLEFSSNYQGVLARAEWISKEDAARWLLLMEEELPEDLAKLAEEVSE